MEYYLKITKHSIAISYANSKIFPVIARRTSSQLSYTENKPVYDVLHLCQEF